MDHGPGDEGPDPNDDLPPIDDEDCFGDDDDDMDRTDFEDDDD